ncbi:MAG: class I SAM-dependent methyltransferase [Burkholderiales bacterium]
MLQQTLLKHVKSKLEQHKLLLSVKLWNDSEVQSASPAKVRMSIHTPHALKALIKPSLGGLASQYVRQEIDLEGDPRDIILLGEQLCNVEGDVGKSSKPLFNWKRRTKDTDRSAIGFHYDVSDAFYNLWLDRRRVYSCAYFRNENDSLDRAQEQKLDHICRKLMLHENERFLDIGCGWGALLLWAVENYGVNATGITLSRNQFLHVQAAIRERGLESRCQVQYLDYRDLSEEQAFDKIASVGMFEHVGRKNFGRYFDKIRCLLKPGGLVLNHGITFGQPGGHGLGSEISEFIDRYVFPDGELVHIAEVIDAMSQQGLESLDCENLRPHYAKTLWHWVDRLENRQDEARRLVGESRFRTWRIYMAGSAHAFERGWLSIYQVLAGRPLEDGRMPVPLTRDHIYSPS